MMNQFFKNVGNIEDNTAGVVNNSKGTVIEFKRLRGNEFVKIKDNRNKKEISFCLQNALTASSILNDSNVSGSNVKNALNDLSTSINNISSSIKQSFLSVYYVSSTLTLTGAFTAFGEIYGPTVSEISKQNILFNSGTGVSTIQNEGYYRIKIVTHIKTPSSSGSIDSYTLFFGTSSIDKYTYIDNTSKDFNIDIITPLTVDDEVYLYIDAGAGRNTSVFQGSVLNIEKI